MNAEPLLALSCLLLFGAVAIPAHAQSIPDPGSPGILLAAADSGDLETGHGAASAHLDAVDSYRLALLKLKGHLGIARTLLKLRAPGAARHLQQPVREIFRGIEPELESRNAPLSADTLVQLERAAVAAPQAALATIDLAAAAIDGSFAQTGAMNTRSVLGLSTALLRESVDLYADSVTNNEVVDLQGYQTGRGFVLQAETLVRHSSALEGRPGREALLAAVVLIRQAWPGVNPPPIVFAPRGVAGRLDEALAAMDRLQ